MLEKLIAFHCAPALAGIKSANIASCNKSRIPDVHRKIAVLNRQLNCRDIYIKVLCECEKSVLVIVYRKEKLLKQLQDSETAHFLQSYGYGSAHSVDEYIAILKKRLTQKDFPHEIGAFLGYPIQDIYGFIADGGRNCLIIGEWKVYGDAEKAQKLFSRYKACRNGVVKRLKKGDTLAEIFCAA